MNDERVKLVHRVSVNLALIIGGWALLYLLCWLFESGADGHAVERWSDSRCGFAILGTLLAFAFKRQAEGGRP